MPEHCPNCNTSLIGEYCHTCGQRRIGGPITVQAFIGEVLRRVFRLDRAVITTFSAMLRSPGALVADYLEDLPVVLSLINANSPLVWDATMLGAARRRVLARAGVPRSWRRGSAGVASRVRVREVAGPKCR